MFTNSLLSANNLTKNFIQDDNKLSILQDINIAFDQGKSYAITGVSGSGKTTLLHLLAGTDMPSSGQIYFNNSDINKFNSKQKENFLSNEIGLVFQEPYLIKELSVLENIIIKGLINKKNIDECKQQGIILLEQIGLASKPHQLPTTLSIGQQQRVSILRALFNKPKFLLADEPTANLDEKNAYEIISLLNDFKIKFSTGLIIVTHDKNLYEALDCRLYLNNGELNFVG